MASELEQFRAALNAQRVQSGSGYCNFAHIDAALHQATHPSGTPTADYPRMLFFRGNPLEYRIVQNEEEETQATAQGYLRTADPPDPAYPKYFSRIARIRAR